MRRNRRITGRSAPAVSALAALALVAGAAGGAPSSLDRTFADNGRITIDSGDDESVYGLALQPDGKIVAVGWSATDDAIVYRLTANGKLDRSFDGTGTVAINSGGSEYAAAAAAQRDGRIVVVGHTSVDWNAAVYRLTRNGSLDKSFDGDGAVGLDAGGNESAYGVAVQPDGKIVVAGRTSVGDDAAVWRLTAGGKPDPTFGGGDGMTTIDSGGSEGARSLALQRDGKIVVAGYTSVKEDAAVYRLNRNGSLDKSFDGDGAVGLDSGGEESAYGVAVQPDGKIVVAGYTSVNEDAAVYRLNHNGSLDRSFDGDGAVGIDSGDYEYANAVALQPNGKILVAGYADTTQSGVLYRLNRNGSLDRGFGDDGTRIISIDRFGEATAVAVQRDGRIVVGGWGYDDDYDSTVVRLAGDRPPLCGGTYATIVGTPRGERLTGTPGPDVIAGLGGRDTIRGLAGNDVLCGGKGKDRLYGGSGNDRLVGGPGRDRLVGGPGRDRVRQ